VLNSHESHFADSRRIRLLLGTMIALVVADGLISEFLITRGFAYEGNPLLQAWASQNFIKLLGALLSALILWDIYKHYPRLSSITTLCLVTLYTIIVFWNVIAFSVAQL